MNREEALELLKLSDKPSTEHILSKFNQIKMHEPANIQLYEQAKDLLLLENLRQDCINIGELLKECNLELEIKIIPPYIKTKIEFEEHKRNLVYFGTVAIKDQALKILSELEAWDDLRRHPKIGTALEYFHFDNHLPKLYKEIFTHSLDETHISLDKLTGIKISLMNYRNYIFMNLKNYCLSIIEQFGQAHLYKTQELHDMQDNIEASQSLEDISKLLLNLIDEEQNQLNQLKENCVELERLIKGIHSPKPTHVFSPILHWYHYKLLLLEELKNQSITQLFHLCREFSKEEVSWTDFFNYVSYEIHHAKDKTQVILLSNYFKEITLDYYQIKDWLKMQSFHDDIKTSLKAAFGLIPPNLRQMTFNWLKSQNFKKNILIDTIILKTLEISKDYLMSLAGIAPYSHQIHQTSELREISKIDIKMRL